MDQRHLDQGEEYPTLGPHYFVARDVAEKIMAGFEPDHFIKILKKAADDFYGELHERVEEFLMADAEYNVQGTIWHQIDESVKALLSGKEWALKRYLLGERYEHGEIRAAVAKVIPKELQDARVKDLEDENAKLKEEVRRLRERY